MLTGALLSLLFDFYFNWESWENQLKLGYHCFFAVCLLHFKEV